MHAFLLVETFERFDRVLKKLIQVLKKMNIINKSEDVKSETTKNVEVEKSKT